MKKVTKALSLILVLVLTTMAFAGCGTDTQNNQDGQKDPQYTSIEAVDISALTLDSAQKNGVKISFDSTKWHHWEQMQNLGIALTETWEQDNTVNIQVIDNGEPNASEVTETHLEQLMKGFEGAGDWFDASVHELRMFEGKKVIYIETAVSCTEDYLAFLVESGSYTQEWVDENKEELLNAPSTKQVQVYTIVDGHLISYVGTYYEDAHKQVAMDAITVAIQTTEIQ